MPKHLNVDRKSIIRLSGITDPTVPTLGKLSVKFGNYETEMHIVTDDFPIDQDALLGSVFLWETKANLNFGNGCLEIGKDSFPFTKSLKETHENCFPVTPLESSLTKILITNPVQFQNPNLVQTPIPKLVQIQNSVQVPTPNLVQSPIPKLVQTSVNKFSSSSDTRFSTNSDP